MKMLQQFTLRNFTKGTLCMSCLEIK